MAMPTHPEMTTMVYNAFKKLGFGSVLSTYDVINRHPWLELQKYEADTTVSFRVLTQEELNARAGDLEQNAERSVLELNKRKLGTEMYTCARLMQNMVVKLVRQCSYSLYYDKVRNTIIIKHGNAIVETCPKISYDVDVTSASVYDYLDVLGELIDECKDVKDVKIFTTLGKVCVKLPCDHVVETDCTVEEFNGHWEK